jgi:hypothetical protein
MEGGLGVIRHAGTMTAPFPTRVELETRGEGLETADLNVSGLMSHNRGMKYGYARASTNDQNADMQMKPLSRAGCRKQN